MASIWDQSRIERMINDQIEENLTLEYKGMKSLGKDDRQKEEISKDVSSMANSAGGILIYGVSEYDDKGKKHLPKAIEPINRQEFSREWLDQVISSNIRPRIEGLIIHPVSLNETPNDVAYVIEIPQSTTAHQANDRRYYKRHNFHVLPMEDYEIRDIMARNKYPRIDLSFTVNSNFVDGPRMFVFAENKGSVYAKYVKGILWIPAVCLNDPKAISIGHQFTDKTTAQTFWEVYTDNRQRDIIDQGYSINPSGIGERTMTQGPSWFDPILPGCIMQLRHLVMASDFNNYKRMSNLSIRWTVYADNASPNSGETLLADIREAPYW